MKQYKQLNKEERKIIYIMRLQGKSFRAIGSELGRNASTLCREYNRNKCSIGYLPDTANQMSRSRKAVQKPKLDKHPELKKYVISKMRNEKYSPEMIAGVLKVENADLKISHESIYKYVHSEHVKQEELYKLLPRERPKRRARNSRKSKSDYGIPNRVSVHDRLICPQKNFGHFEIDLTFFKGDKKRNLLTIVDRSTGYLMAHLNESKDSKVIAKKILESLVQVPKHLRQSATFDNGREFVSHTVLNEVLKLNTFFCDPASPWQKPYVEHSHALLHRFIPKNTNMATFSTAELKNALDLFNNLPRKRLGFLSPKQAFFKNFSQLVALRT